MKTSTGLFNLISGLALSACLVAFAGTNVFETIESAALSHARLQNLALPKLDARALRPANEDPDGNWGANSRGLLLSLRFEKRVYEADQPINAVVILRNATNSEVRYRECALGGGPSREIQMSAVEFLVTNDTTHSVVEAKRIDTVFQHHESIAVQPLQQILYVHRLDEILNLVPGDYSVQAMAKLIVGLDSSSPPLTSRVARFTVVPGSTKSKGPDPLRKGTTGP
jgi:hypothetical protein